MHVVLHVPVCVFLHVCVYVNHMETVKCQLLLPQTHVVQNPRPPHTQKTPETWLQKLGHHLHKTCLGNTRKHTHARTHNTTR